MSISRQPIYKHIDKWQQYCSKRAYITSFCSKRYDRIIHGNGGWIQAKRQTCMNGCRDICTRKRSTQYCIMLHSMERKHVQSGEVPTCPTFGPSRHHISSFSHFRKKKKGGKINNSLLWFLQLSYIFDMIIISDYIIFLYISSWIIGFRTDKTSKILVVVSLCNLNGLRMEVSLSGFQAENNFLLQFPRKTDACFPETFSLARMLSKEERIFSGVWKTRTPSHPPPMAVLSRSSPGFFQHGESTRQHKEAIGNRINPFSKKTATGKIPERLKNNCHWQKCRQLEELSSPLDWTISRKSFTVR